jgi:transcriptional regulator with XRE-family HTH domain
MTKNQDSSTTKILSLKIKHLIKKLGFKQQIEFANKIGVSNTRVSNYVNEKSKPDHEFFLKLKLAFPIINLNDFYDLSHDDVRINDEPIQLPKSEIGISPKKYYELLEKHVNILEEVKSNHRI